MKAPLHVAEWETFCPISPQSLKIKKQGTPLSRGVLCRSHGGPPGAPWHPSSFRRLYAIMRDDGIRRRLYSSFP